MVYATKRVNERQTNKRQSSCQIENKRRIECNVGGQFYGIFVCYCSLTRQ